MSSNNQIHNKTEFSSDSENLSGKQTNTNKQSHWVNLGRATINGVMGDYLASKNSPLAIDMALLPTKSSAITQNITLTSKVVVLVHGLTNLETIWNIPCRHPSGTTESTDDFSGSSDNHSEAPINDELSNAEDNYGTRLQEEQGFTPLYLRYNTGLNIEANGRSFAKKLEAMMNAYPIKIDELVIIGFSMGGLVSRYAQMAAIEENQNWLKPLTQCIYVGSPHEGSPWEKFGHLTSAIVREFPKDYVSQWADWIDIRSEGIQNLKDGLAKRVHPNPDTDNSHTPCGSFYKHAEHKFISGGLAKQANDESKKSFMTSLLGDSLVRTPSAIPQGAPKDSESQHFDHIPHLSLAHSNRVYKQVRSWLSASAKGTSVEEPSAEEIKRHASNLSLLNFLDHYPDQDISTNELTSSSLELGAEGFKHTVDAIRTTHLAIADEPFNVLNKIPGISPVSKNIEKVHHGISKGTYEAVGLGRHVLKTAANLVKTKER